MNLAHVFGQDLSFHCISNCAPIVFVVDGDISVRESLDLLIRCEGWQAETFESVQEFLARPRPLVPNCLVLDVSLPGLDALDLQKRIAIERPEVPIIFISRRGDIRTTVEAMKAGRLGKDGQHSRSNAWRNSSGVRAAVDQITGPSLG